MLIIFSPRKYIYKSCPLNLAFVARVNYIYDARFLSTFDVKFCIWSSLFLVQAAQERILNNPEMDFDDDLIDFEALLEDDSYMPTE